MEISGIDESFVDIVKALNENGFKPFASCDGVVSHHTRENKPSTAYISFLESSKILDLLAACSRDDDIFRIVLSSETESKPYELYGNEISGNTYSIYFENLEDEKTEYFRRIVNGIITGKIKISEEEKRDFVLLSEFLLEKDTDLNFSISENSVYQPITKKQGKATVLTITSKENEDDVAMNMGELKNKIAEQYGLPAKKYDFEEPFEEDEFVATWFDDCTLEIYFKELNVSRIIDIMRFAKSQEKYLSTFKRVEPEDYYDFDYEEYYEENDFDDNFEM